MRTILIFHQTLKNSHLNVNAIYYRLFIEDYLPKNIEFILYVDSDAYFIKDYHSKLIEEIAKLEEEGKRTLSAQTGHKITKVDNRLNLKSGKFLNSESYLLTINFGLKINVHLIFQKCLTREKLILTGMIKIFYQFFLMAIMKSWMNL